MPILNDSEQLFLYYCTKYHLTQAVLLMKLHHSHAHIPEGNFVKLYDWSMQIRSGPLRCRRPCFISDEPHSHLHILQGSPPGSKCLGEWRKVTLFTLPGAMTIFVCNTSVCALEPRLPKRTENGNSNGQERSQITTLGVS